MSYVSISLFFQFWKCSSSSSLSSSSVHRYASFLTRTVSFFPDTLSHIPLHTESMVQFGPVLLNQRYFSQLVSSLIPAVPPFPLSHYFFFASLDQLSHSLWSDIFSASFVYSYILFSSSRKRIIKPLTQAFETIIFLACATTLKLLRNFRKNETQAAKPHFNRLPTKLFMGQSRGHYVTDFYCTWFICTRGCPFFSRTFPF